MTENPTELWTYCGRRQLHPTGLGHLFLTADGEERLFKKVFTTGSVGIIGATYRVEVPKPGSVVIGSARYQSAEPRPEKADEWAAQDRAASVADTARKREAKDAKEGRDLGSLTLAELSRICVRLPAPQRIALEVQVLARLRMVKAS